MTGLLMQNLCPRILCLAPHLDDEVIGAGGALLQAVASGAKCVVAYLTEPTGDTITTAGIRYRESISVGFKLGLTSQVFLNGADEGFLAADDTKVKEVARILRDFKPSIVYCPHPEEEHFDHQATYAILARAVWISGIGVHTDSLGQEKHRPTNIRLYEVWTPLSRFNCVVDITDKSEDKSTLVRTYKSQIARRRYDLSSQALASYRAISLGLESKKVEVFWEITPSKLGAIS
jgi:LmbE family N-acetylglucosaminyl deacetylase